MVRNNRGEVNGKSILNLMTLAAAYGTELTLIFEGEEARKALRAVESLFYNKFGERE
jgi:phosphocarrier protein